MPDLNLIDYEISKRLSYLDLPFASLVAAAMRKADTDNMRRLKEVFPQIHEDLQARYSAPGGVLASDNCPENNMDEFIFKAGKIAASYVRIEK